MNAHRNAIMKSSLNRKKIAGSPVGGLPGFDVRKIVE